jgi:hypothetical protein
MARARSPGDGADWRCSGGDIAPEGDEISGSGWPAAPVHRVRGHAMRQQAYQYADSLKAGRSMS